jgi:hypothetical protein
MPVEAQAMFVQMELNCALMGYSMHLLVNPDLAF